MEPHHNRRIVGGEVANSHKVVEGAGAVDSHNCLGEGGLHSLVADAVGEELHNLPDIQLLDSPTYLEMVMMVLAEKARASVAAKARLKAKGRTCRLLASVPPDEASGRWSRCC